MGKSCGCGGKISGFDTNGMMEGGANIAAAYGGFWVGQEVTKMATDAKTGISYFQDNPETAKLILGGGKVATAIGVPMFFPKLINRTWKLAVLLGFGASGVGELVDGVDRSNGIGQPYDWDSYDSFKENRTDTSNMV